MLTRGETIWGVVVNPDGHAYGMDLHMRLALRMYEIKRTDAMQQTLLDFVWERMRPTVRTRMPGDFLAFVDDSMLVREIRHYDCSSALRPALRLYHVSWRDRAVPGKNTLLRYGFRLQWIEDYESNDWLKQVFVLWFEFMHTQLLMQEKAG